MLECQYTLFATFIFKGVQAPIAIAQSTTWSADTPFSLCIHLSIFKGVLHLWALFLKTLCIFSKTKATSDKVSYGSGLKCSKELKNHSFTSVETIVVKLR